MSVTLYGIPNCDTVRLTAWAEAAGWDKVLNRAGTTFRKLPDADRLDLDMAKAVALMVANPSCIKRPVLEHPGGVLVGFKPDEWAAAL